MRKTGNPNACMMRNGLDTLNPGCTGILTDQFAPGAGELLFFNTWLVLNSPLCPGVEGSVVSKLLKHSDNNYEFA